MNLFPERFKGQCAIVTGAASGIGLAVSIRLAREGARVSGWDLLSAPPEAARDAFAHWIVMDQSDEDAAAAAAAQSARTLGKIDILIVSAGITGPNTSLVTYPTEAWRSVMNVNVNGVFYVNRAVIPLMLKNSYGRIVNVASVAGKEGIRTPRPIPLPKPRSSR